MGKDILSRDSVAGSISEAESASGGSIRTKNTTAAVKAAPILIQSSVYKFSIKYGIENIFLK